MLQNNLLAQMITTFSESLVQKKLVVGKLQSMIFGAYRSIFIRVYKNVISIINNYFHFKEHNTFRITNVILLKNTSSINFK